MLFSVLFGLGVLLGTPAPADVAEGVRLSDEMRRYSLRDAWAGVDTAYRGMLELEIEPSFDDHLRGAHAAAAVGDIGAVRVRLLRAHALQESREVIEWMWTIDEGFGRVVLQAEGEPLEPKVAPFNPTAARSIELARTTLASDGSFDGFLPAGTYRLGSHAFSVEPRKEPLQVDARDTGRRTAKRR